MTPNAEDFLDELRARDSGLDWQVLIEMWKPREPKELRAVLDELERHGEIAFDTGIQDGPNPEKTRHGLHNVVGIRLRR